MYGKGDNAVLGQRSDTADRPFQFLIANLHNGLAAGRYTVAIRIGYLALYFEVAQIGDDGNLRTLRHLRANLVIDVSKDGLTWRTDLRVVQRTFGFGQRLAENAEIQFLHLVFRIQHFFLVGILLLQLFVFQLGHIIAQLRLTHFIGSAGAEAVEVLLIAQLHLFAVQLHGRNLYLHLQVIQLGHVLQFELFQLVAAHLFLVQLLLIIGFGALQVQLQDRRAYIHAVAAFLIYFQNTGVDRRIDNLLKGRNHLA